MSNDELYAHQDTLAALNANLPLAAKMNVIHQRLIKRYPFVDHIMATVYDPEGQRLKTFVQGSGQERAPLRYETELGSLRELLDARRPRVVNDVRAFAEEGHADSGKVADRGIRSSYTMPMFTNNALFGFIFFNSRERGSFTPDVLEAMDLYGHLVAQTVINELNAIKTLLATVRAARDMTDHRDTETGAHVSRTAAYARLIAREVAEEQGFDDDYVEHIFLFSPLHDIGKIGVPDAILRKPGRLSEEEYAHMQQHARKGSELIDRILSEFGLAGVAHLDMLRNIARFHHEAIDGSGYPMGLKGDEIPAEARIMAVADVFDALTSKRPYKEAWDNAMAFEMLHKLAGVKLDRSFVEALTSNLEEVERIQERFREE